VLMLIFHNEDRLAHSIWLSKIISNRCK